MEYQDLYDCHRQKLNLKYQRGNPVLENTYRIVVHVCIFNNQNKMLIQKRAKNKSSWPYMWDVSVGGHVLVDETSEEAAMRETKEELGIDIDLTNQCPILTNHFKNGFDDFYIVIKDVEEITLQEDEVLEVKWANEQEILNMIQDKTFIPYYASFISLLFAMKDRIGLTYE
ncbi:MAG: NUDIX domain-containing protein [Erysipelotrichaceae bacterium]|nr:NUDIX domain-containing protein [Erysipelotrichaceae bacterium]